MCRIASLFLLQELKGSVRRRTRFQQHRDASCHQVFFYASLMDTLGEHAPSYATVKNWVAQFQRGDFSTCVLLISAGAFEGHFEAKRRGKFTKGLLFLHNAPAHRALATQKKLAWPTWASNVLITHPILRIWPRRTTTCSLD